MKGKNPFNYRQLFIRNYQPQTFSYQPYYSPQMQGFHQQNIPYQNPYGNYPPFIMQQQMPYGPPPIYQQHQIQGNSGNGAQYTNIFQNPLQALDSNHYNMNQQNMQNQFTNPYPQSGQNLKPQQGGMNSLMNSFKSQDGSIDFNKMVNTAGQMMNAVNQVSSMVKGLGGLFKG